jgi:hypothetical protein
MRRLALVAFALLTTSRANAQADFAGAREQLKIGAELRKAGKCNEAIPHLIESQRLDPQAKALINLADCEERVGQLVAAQKHWVEARDRAAVERNEAIRGEAESRLGAIEKRLPRMTIVLAASAPRDCEVTKDGVVLGAVSLGVPIPVDPGRHTIKVRASGHADSVTEVTCAERDACAATVDVGPLRPVDAPAPTVPKDPATPPETVTAPPPAAESGTSAGTRRTIGLVLGGVGLVGLGVGAYFGLSAKSKWGDASAHCHGQACDATGVSLANDAKSAGNGGTILFAGGAVLVAAGAVLWFTAPAPSRTGLRVTPLVGPGAAGLAVSGGLL